MKSKDPEKVIITGGHEVGGLSSYAEALAEGFYELGIPTEIISPQSIYRRLRDLRSRKVLKILSTTAAFAAPFARRAICACHGCPCADVQGWAKVLGFLGSYKIANWSPDTKFVSVSEYTAIHLQQIFNIKIDAVIRNPVKSIFFETLTAPQPERVYITYVGRLHPSKNIHRLLPAILHCLADDSRLRACIVGDGVLLRTLQRMYVNEKRIEFFGPLGSRSVRDVLRQSKVFISGNQTEAYGITYLEALSQGCAVVMPASGGGMEIAPELIGKQIQLMSISLREKDVVPVLRRALNTPCARVVLPQYTVKAVAQQYLQVDRGELDACWSPARTILTTTPESNDDYFKNTKR